MGQGGERTRRIEQSTFTDHAVRYIIGEQGGRAEGGGTGVCYHTNATGSHIGGNHNGALSGLELVKNPVTLVLLLVAVDCY